MDPHDSSPTASLGIDPGGTHAANRRIAWHAVAVVLAALLAWLVFSAYRQPDLILDLAGMRLC